MSLGNLYVSDGEGQNFVLSMSNVVKGRAIDFQKVNSLNGVYLANRFDLPNQAKSRPTDYWTDSRHHQEISDFEA